MAYQRTRESFKSNTNVAFDALGAVASASDMTLRLLLNPERANRLVEQHAISEKNLGLDGVLNPLIEHCFKIKMNTSYEEEVCNTIQYRLLQNLFNLISSAKSIAQVKAIANKNLDDLISLLNDDNNTFNKQLLREINEYRKHPEKFKTFKTPKIPDGSPIGSFQCSIQ
jgi:hypothetical protein